MSETSKEKQYLRPVIKDYSGDMSLDSFFAWLLVMTIVVLCTGYIHYFVEQKISLVPVAHADTKQLTDRQQEQQYCAAWSTQKEAVVGGTTDAIRKHCENYLN